MACYLDIPPIPITRRQLTSITIRARCRGAKGIGFETSVYLALKGATVYIAARDSRGTHEGIENVRQRLRRDTGGEDLDTKIKYHELDVGSMRKAWESARAFLKVESRLDILICNAGVSMTTMRELSPDGFDPMFTVNHLGHVAFITGVLGILFESPFEREIFEEAGELIQ